MSGYFDRERTRDGEVFTPTTDAVSGWGALVRGPAMTALLARQVERTALAHGVANGVANADADPLDAGAFIPAKTTFDLHSPVPLAPLQTRASVLRDGRRLKLIDAELIHDGRVYARARSLWLRRDPATDVSDNIPWQAEHVLPIPGPGPWSTTDDGRIYWSERADGQPESASEATSRWSERGVDHQNGERKAVWQFPIPTIIGEELTGFQVAANVCDVANLATGWGPRGIEFINADASLSMVRYPESSEVGVTAVDRIEQDGIAVGTAALYDRHGRFATAQVTTLVQPGGRIHFVDPALDPSNKLTRPVE